MIEKPELYFKKDNEWYNWLYQNYDQYENGIYLVFYKLEAKIPTMRWEEAVRVALCFGWIDSTVKNVGGPKRIQYFCKRKPKSVWSKVNKTHVEELIATNKMHEAGYRSIEIAKENGSWIALDDVENGLIPMDLQKAFNGNQLAFSNYQGFTFSNRKSYLYWLNQARRQETREKRIKEIIRLCSQGIKSRNTW
ncbi:YdeI/OmpD-associated family protein [Spongiivirga citrea]|uniref:Bacteriocin-protection protein n=1 Tax=Spongiivirga citrea TaxID=1481457 RepID=A0A6M0CSP5_9FLAO|nr:YdeI/OmpD-associated family protein [Spongiivirga citrea]NER18517.1 hypothetical protein [Spongiivirga citrea]